MLIPVVNEDNENCIDWWKNVDFVLKLLPIALLYVYNIAYTSNYLCLYVAFINSILLFFVLYLLSIILLFTQMLPYSNFLNSLVNICIHFFHSFGVFSCLCLLLYWYHIFWYILLIYSLLRVSRRLRLIGLRGVGTPSISAGNSLLLSFTNSQLYWYLHLLTSTYIY